MKKQKSIGLNGISSPKSSCRLSCVHTITRVWLVQIATAIYRVNGDLNVEDERHEI